MLAQNINSKNTTKRQRGPDVSVRDRFETILFFIQRQSIRYYIIEFPGEINYGMADIRRF